jgi:hypothetical protein
MSNGPSLPSYILKNSPRLFRTEGIRLAECLHGIAFIFDSPRAGEPNPPVLPPLIPGEGGHGNDLHRLPGRELARRQCHRAQDDPDDRISNGIGRHELEEHSGQCLCQREDEDQTETDSGKNQCSSRDIGDALHARNRTGAGWKRLREETQNWEQTTAILARFLAPGGERP